MLDEATKEPTIISGQQILQGNRQLLSIHIDSCYSRYYWTYVPTRFDISRSYYTAAAVACVGEGAMSAALAVAVPPSLESSRPLNPPPPPQLPGRREHRQNKHHGYTLSMATVVQDEARWIVEWIEYHMLEVRIAHVPAAKLRCEPLGYLFTLAHLVDFCMVCSEMAPLVDSSCRSVWDGADMETGQDESLWDVARWPEIPCCGHTIREGSIQCYNDMACCRRLDSRTSSLFRRRDAKP
eukprot:3914705-Pleurochrysis_carterae.AAC.1